MKTQQTMTHEHATTQNGTGRLTTGLRIAMALLVTLVLGSGLSCAVTPTADTAEPAAKPVTTRPVNAGLRSAYTNYEKRDYAAAAAEYDQLTASVDAKDSIQRLAHLGKALVYLSTDPHWRNLEAAGHSLQSAEVLESGNKNLETSMLMNALSALIVVESNISELDTKVANSAAEIARLKHQTETLKAEQVALNEALEKLKALTIGN